MDILNGYIVISKVVPFSHKIHVLRKADKQANNIYHWLWFTFGTYNRYRFILRFRPIRHIFNKNWYSAYRWKNPTEYYGETIRLFDIGFIVIGYSK